MHRRAIVLSLALLAGLTACSSKHASAHSSAPTATPSPASARVLWPRPTTPTTLAHKAGLALETAESLQHHVHAHLDVFVDGQPIVVPAGIGVDITDAGVHTFHDAKGTSYGGITTPCARPCISPLHTHDDSGVLHTESKSPVPNTLGEFFTEWGVRLSPTCVGEFCAPGKHVAFYVDGVSFSDDPRTMQLNDQWEIAIVIGTPPAVIPSYFPAGAG